MAMIPAMSAADFGTGGTAVMNYGMQIGKDLAAYGEKIGLQIKDNRDKQQAMGSLPALQEAMQAFQAGESGAGYSSIINLAAQDPSNPYVQNLVKLGMMGGTAIDENRYRMRMAEAATARASGTATEFTPDIDPQEAARRVLLGDNARPRDTQREETITIDGENGTSTVDFSKPPTEIVPDNAEAIDAANANNLPTDQGEQPQQELSEEQKNMVPQIRNFRTLAPADKQQVLSSATTTQKPEGYEARSITGLSELYPNLTGDMLIPEVGTKTTIKRTVSTSDKPGSEIRESFAEDNIKVGEKLYDFNSKSAENIPAAVNAMTKQAPADSKKTFVKLFNENGGIENAVISPTEDPKVYKLFFNGNDKDEYTISDTQANNLSIAQSIPALAGSGVQFLGKEKSKEDKSKPQPGLPAVQAGPVAPQIPEAAGNPFAAKLEKIQKTETVAGKNKTVQEVSRVIETVTRLEQTLAGLAKGEMPETIDYLPRAKKAALQGTDLEGLKKEFNILANLKPAIEWVRKNPNDPKAAQAAEAIRQQLGI
jgi:hypothetical protein